MTGLQSKSYMNVNSSQVYLIKESLNVGSTMRRSRKFCQRGSNSDDFFFFWGGGLLGGGGGGLR